MDSWIDGKQPIIHPTNNPIIRYFVLLHPDSKFENHEHAYVEFEIVMLKDRKGVRCPRWVLRGLVAM